MKAFVFRDMAIVVGSLMGLMLVGCQQGSPPPVVVNTPGTERTTTTSTETKQVETPAPTPAPDRVQTQTTEKTTTVEKKPQ